LERAVKSLRVGLEKDKIRKKFKIGGVKAVVVDKEDVD
jgi:hypothetical protein